MITNDVENTWCQIEWLDDKQQVERIEYGFVAHIPSDLFDQAEEHPSNDKVYWWLDTTDWEDLVNNKTITIAILEDNKFLGSVRISITDKEQTINDIKRELEEAGN